MNKPLVDAAAEQVQRLPAPAKAPIDLAAVAGGVVSIMDALTGFLGFLVAACSLAWAGLRLHMMYAEWKEWRKTKESSPSDADGQ